MPAANRDASAPIQRNRPKGYCSTANHKVSGAPQTQRIGATGPNRELPGAAAHLHSSIRVYGADERIEIVEPKFTRHVVEITVARVHALLTLVARMCRTCPWATERSSAM